MPPTPAPSSLKSEHDKLDRAIWESRRRLKFFRENARDRIIKAAGGNYGAKRRAKRPVNLMALYSSILAHRLMSTDPKLLFTTEHQELEESALEQEGAANTWIQRTNAGRHMNEAVMHCIFAGLGILQVGIESYSCASDDPGEVRFRSIGYDDWVHDMAALRLDDCSFMGHRYRVPLEEVKADNTIPQAVRDKMAAVRVAYRNEQGDEKVQAISQDYREFAEEWEDHIELWQLWLPRKKLLRTYVAADPTGGLAIVGEPIREVKWDGPRHGPYHILQFAPLPNNTIPVAASASWEDIDDAANDIARKIINDSRRTKALGIYQQGQSDDARKIKEAVNGELIGLTDPTSVQERIFGQPNQVLVVLLTQFRQMANYLAGNIDQVGGLSSEADTLGQERMLSASSSQTIGSMQNRVMQWAVPAFRDATYWLFTDPQLNLRTSKRVPGTDVSIPFTMTSAHVQGHPDDYEIDIAPYSHSYRTPQERLGQFVQLLQTVFMPLQPGFAQAGASFDFEYLTRMIARYSGMPEIERFLQFYGPDNPNVTPQETGTSTAGGGPSVREYVRRDRGGPQSQAANDQATAAMLSAASSNGSSNGSM